MNKHKPVIILVTTALLLLFAASIYGLEAYDHPLVGRYGGSAIIHQESSNFDRYRLGLSAAEDGTVAETLTVEGKVLMTLYSGPEDASAFEVITAYRKLLQSDEFDILFSCEKAACGEGFLGAFYDLAPFANDPGWNNSSPITQGNPDASYVLVAKSESEAKTMYVSLIVSQGWWSYPVYKLDIVEVQEFEGKISSVTGPGGETGDAVREPADASTAERTARRPVRFGLLLYANRFEVSAKAQATLHDDPADPDEILMIGAHASFLFKPTENTDLGLGVEVRRGIKLSGVNDYEQYMDGGPRLSINYNLGEHFLLSGVLHPVWVVVRETTVADSFTLDAKIPYASVAVSFLF